MDGWVGPKAADIVHSGLEQMLRRHLGLKPEHTSGDSRQVGWAGAEALTFYGSQKATLWPFWLKVSLDTHPPTQVAHTRCVAALVRSFAKGLCRSPSCDCGLCEGLTGCV